MQTDPTPLDERLQRMVNLKVPGIDIMHGELKMRMLEAEAELTEAQRIEEENDYSDAMESMERKYWEGYYDALVLCYGLTYDISFACSAFPNPCTAYLTLQMDDSGNEVKNITVTDTQGRMFYKSKLESNRLNLDVRGWANGAYVFRIQNAKGQERTILINKL